MRGWSKRVGRYEELTAKEMNREIRQIRERGDGRGGEGLPRKGAEGAKGLSASDFTPPTGVFSAGS
jgi:hypothetical protein